jgi:hypothetical protein
MRKTQPLALLLLLFASSSRADGWSLGIGTGPFVFGTFVERTTRVGNDAGSATITSKLSAATRPGGSVDIEHDLNDWLGIRLDAAWTRAPIKVKSSSSQGVSFDAGHANITTVALPLVINLNRHGAFRAHLVAGPSYAFYDMKARTGGGATLSLFDGTRGRWGGVAGGGVAWWMRERFALEGEVADIVTSSPFRRSDFTSTFGGIKIPKTHNVHSTVGIRYRF